MSSLPIRMLILICLAGVAAPVYARSGRPRPRPRPRLGLWDRVLIERYEKAQRLLERANRHLKRREHDVAIDLLRKAVKIRPYAASLWLALGTVYSHGEKYKGCVSALRRARSLDDSHQPNLVAFRLGICLTMSGQIAEGIREYQQVRPAGRIDQAVLHWNMADGFMALGRLNESIAHYREALRRDPGRAVIHFALAVALDRQGRWRTARRRMKRANQLDPKGESLSNPAIVWLPAHEPYYYHALRHQVAGRRLEALTSWRRYHRSAGKADPWRWSVLHRLREIPGPLDARVLSDRSGPLDRDRLLASLNRVQASLRGCLGAESNGSAGPAIGDFRGVRVKMKIEGRRLQKVTISREEGPVAGNARACLSKLVGRLPWSRVTTGPGRAGASFDLTGPAPGDGS